MTILLRDIEVAIIQKIRDWADANDIKVDEPGALFDAAKAESWIRPRLTLLSNTAISRPSAQWEQVVFEVRAHIKSEPKGCAFPKLSILVDQLLNLLDPARGAGCIEITDIDEPPPPAPTPTTTGYLVVNNVLVSLEYETSTVAHSITVEGLDIATITLQGNVESA